MKDIEKIISQGLNAARIKIASPERIHEWSFGEIKNRETVNWRTYKTVSDGLICAKIFGPLEDWECMCGKYKGVKGIVCDKCGVELIETRARGLRLGHICLESPVAHIGCVRGIPSRIGTLLEMTIEDLEKVLYFKSYIVTDPGDSILQKGELLSETTYRKRVMQVGSVRFRACMGAEAIRELLWSVDLEMLRAKIAKKMKEAVSPEEKINLAQKLKIVESFIITGANPASMTMDVIPVLPPNLRPIHIFEGDRWISSDLNDLYGRVIERNNRIRELIEQRAPSDTLNPEKKKLQEAVDALFFNGWRKRVLKPGTNRQLTCLSDLLEAEVRDYRMKAEMPDEPVKRFDLETYHSKIRRVRIDQDANMYPFDYVEEQLYYPKYEDCFADQSLEKLEKNLFLLAASLGIDNC